MIGICFLAINNISDKNATWYLYTSIYVCIILSFSSIFILIKALSHRASKSLGCFDMSEISNIQDGIYAHCECLTKLISSTQNTLNQNLDIIKYRSNWIHDSFYWLIGAFIFFMLTSISFTLKDIISRKEVDKMANDNKPVISKDVKPVTTNIITNNKPIQTNDSGIMANKQVPPQKPQSKDTNKTKK
ncbi:hypothetical protein [Campylobacter hyointestinalis]|uniref:hypothetical protein n=1 Tax=Campylobacter hyointestinalis TaxID=198 RepID=UPI0011ADDE82|nr:hypothetical protein [Campylobacter hyointestinalis]TWO30381.1 hypothetical protein YZ79_03390 [Campylobacter hyointestinalis]